MRQKLTEFYLRFVKEVGMESTDDVAEINFAV